jgi:hypothetical protein
MIKKIIAGCLILCISYGIVQGQSGFPWPRLTRDNKPWVRWWWPGNAVDTPGLKYNLQAFHDAGIGGVEVTPIYGVKGFENKFIDFLSPRWMKMLHYTINESDRLHMGVDMVTGTGWPFGGPQITLADAASKVIFQTYTLKGGDHLEQPIRIKDPRQKKIAKLQLLMAYSSQGKKLDVTKAVDKAGNLSWKAPAGTWELIAVFNGKTLQKVKRAAPGGEGWVMDPFSADALHRYLQRFTGAFAKNSCPVPHAFFDDSYEVFGADWSKDLFGEFSKTRGYQLQDYLPALLGQGNKDTVARVTADYRRTLAAMLLNNFADNWTLWAHQMGSLTRYQAHGSPGNLLDLYGAADIPEIESYGSNHSDVPGIPEDSMGGRPGKIDPLLLKFSSSAAHVMGRKLASSETFTWLGEHFRVSLSECKPILDKLLLSGTNHVYFQGSPYSPQDAPWPGWQFYASINVTPYNTFWHDIPAFDQYIGRTQAFLQEGRPDNDVLLYWPVQDVWAMKSRNILFQLTVGNASQWLSPTPFHQVGEDLLHEGYGFDYISDKQLQTTKVTSGALQTPGATYRALLIPPCKYMPEETLQQIARLARAGAKIIFIHSLPQALPGLQHGPKEIAAFKQLKASLSGDQPFTNSNGKAFGQGTLFSGDNLGELMGMAGIRPSGFPAAGLQFIRRKDSLGYIYFIANLQSQPVDQWISLAKNLSSAVLYDPYSGNTGKGWVKSLTPSHGRAREKEPQTALYLQLKPGQSMIVRGYPDKDVTGPVWHYTKPAGEPMPIDGKWKVTFEEGMPVIKKQYEMSHLVSWTTLSDSAKVYAGTASYRCTFDLPKVEAADWLLKLGVVDFSADVKVNGHPAGSLWGVPFEVHIGKYLHTGKNTLEVDVTNLGANRIASYDRKGIYWKKFYDINVVNMQYTPFDAASWNPVSSGLLGPVTLTPLREMHP